MDPVIINCQKSLSSSSSTYNKCEYAFESVCECFDCQELKELNKLELVLAEIRKGLNEVKREFTIIKNLKRQTIIQ